MRRAARWIGWPTAALGFWLAAATAPAAGLPDTVARIRGGVVAVGTVQPTRRPPAVFQATGFAVGDGSLVLTNAHVLKETVDGERKEYTAVFAGRGQNFEARPVTVLEVDREHDLALLRIAGNPLPALKLAEKGQPREGDAVAFTGFPIGIVLGLYPVTHQGIISAISPVAIPAPSSEQLNPELVKRLQKPFEVYQLDAIAYPGNSGSPLYEPGTGLVIGVVNSVFVKESKETVLQQPSGITYAIPVEHVQALLRKVRPAAKP